MTKDLPSFRFGEFQVHPERNEISIGKSTRKLQKQSMDVLVYLLQHNDRVVSAAELLETFWQGRIVEESTIHRQISQIRTALGDSARASAYIRTVSKRGYQAIAEVSTCTPNNVPAIDAKPSPLRIPVVALVLLVTCLLCALIYVFFRYSEPLEAPTVGSLYSVAVLPFDDLTNDPAARHVATGVADELLSRLSEDKELKVSARKDATYLSTAEMRLAELARQLGVSYLVEGSVQQAGSKLRITAQLIRASDGFHVWSVDEDIEMSDLDSQAVITTRIASGARVRLFEDIRREHWMLFEEFDDVAAQAVNLYLDAEEEFNAYSLGEEGDVKLALQLLERAVAVDPEFDAAWLELAWNYAHRIDRSISVAEASEQAHRALAPILEKDPESEDGLFYLAQVYLFLDLDYERAKRTIEAGIRVHPSGRWWNHYLSVIARREGRLEDAFLLLDRSRSRDFRQETGAFYNNFASLLYDMGDYQQSLEMAEYVVSIAPGGANLAIALLYQALSLIAMDDEKSALPLIEEAWQLVGAEVPGVFARPFANTGQRERARLALTTDNLDGVHGYMAEGYFALGEPESAFKLLAAGIEARDASVLDFIRSPMRYAPYTSYPQFNALLDRVAELETLSRAP